jgi:hypothetical protein
MYAVPSVSGYNDVISTKGISPDPVAFYESVIFLLLILSLTRILILFIIFFRSCRVSRGSLIKKIIKHLF